MRDHALAATALFVSAVGWSAIAVSRTPAAAVVFLVAAVLAPLVAFAGIAVERPRWPAAAACVVSLSLATAIYVTLASLPPDFDP